MTRSNPITFGGIASYLCILMPPLSFFTLSTLCPQKARCFEIGQDRFAGVFILAWSAYVAYRLYKNRQVRLSPQYEATFKTAFVQHAIVLLLAAIMLDHGMMMFGSLLAMTAFWMTAGLIIARRPGSLKPSDVAIISWGYIILAFSITCIAWILNASLYDI